MEGSTPYNFLQLLHKFKHEGVANLTSQEKDTVKDFEKNHHEYGQKIALQHQFLRFDSLAQDDKERTEIVRRITEQLRFSFNHQKPERLGLKNGDSQSEDEGSTLQSVLPATFFDRSLEQLLDLDELHRQVKIVEEREQKTEQQVKQVKTEIARLHYHWVERILSDDEASAHDLDWTLFQPSAAYNTAALKDTSSIANSTFFGQIAAYIKELRADKDEFPYFVLLDSFVQNLTLEQMDRLAKLDDWFHTDENFIGAYF